MSVQEVNKLLKMHRQMADMMKKMKKGGMAGMMQALGGGGGMPGMSKGMMPKGGGMPNPGDIDPAMLEDLKKQLGGSGSGVPKLPGIGGKLPGLGGGLGGGGGLPGLGTNPFGKKK